MSRNKAAVKGTPQMMDAVTRSQSKINTPLGEGSCAVRLNGGLP